MKRYKYLIFGYLAEKFISGMESLRLTGLYDILNALD